MTLCLTLPYPPSVNHYWRHVVMGRSARTLISKPGREYRERIGVECMAQGIRQPMAGRLDVRIVLHPPDRRRRDLDNVLKSLLDAMEHGGVYGDDSQIDRIEIVRGPRIKGGRADVVISLWEEHDDT